MGESVDVIDYTLLRKKGILQRVRTSAPSSSSPASNPLASFVPSPSPPSPPSPGASPGGFFGFMDSSASPASSPSPPSSDHSDPSVVSALQIKVDDLDYKLGKLTEQLALLEAKLGSLGGTS